MLMSAVSLLNKIENAIAKATYFVVSVCSSQNHLPPWPCSKPQN
jgi:hypothetical protein